MKETRQLLEKARSLCEPPTWYRLAQRLDVSHGSVSRWTKGDGFPDVKACFELAKLLGREAPTIIAVVEYDRARDEPAKRYWERLLPRVLPAALVAAIAGHGAIHPEMTRLAVLPTPPPRAAARQHLDEGDEELRQRFDTLYIMRTVIRLVRAAARSVRTLSAPAPERAPVC